MTLITELLILRERLPYTLRYYNLKGREPYLEQATYETKILNQALKKY